MLEEQAVLAELTWGGENESPTHWASAMTAQVAPRQQTWFGEGHGLGWHEPPWKVLPLTQLDGTTEMHVPAGWQHAAAVPHGEGLQEAPWIQVRLVGQPLCCRTEHVVALWQQAPLGGGGAHGLESQLAKAWKVLGAAQVP